MDRREFIKKTSLLTAGFSMLGIDKLFSQDGDSVNLKTPCIVYSIDKSSGKSKKGNSLQITNQGHFVSADHIFFEGKEDSYKNVMYDPINGNMFDIDILKRDSNLDLMLGKVEIPKGYSQRSLRVESAADYYLVGYESTREQDNIVKKMVENGIKDMKSDLLPYVYKGFLASQITHKGKNILTEKQDGFYTSDNIRPGFSGSPVYNNAGILAGIATNHSPNLNSAERMHGNGKSSNLDIESHQAIICSNFDAVREFVTSYRPGN